MSGYGSGFGSGFGHGFASTAASRGGGGYSVEVVQGSTQQLSVAWDADPSALVYILQRATDAGFTDATQVYSGTALSFEDTGLTAATTYYYRVYSADEATETLKGDSSGTTAASGGAFDTDAFNLFVAAGITDSTKRTAINAFVLQLKADSLWTDLVALHINRFGNATANGLNWKNPAFLNSAFYEQYFGAVTHNATDILFAGVPTASEATATAACASNRLVPSDHLTSATKTYFLKITASVTNRFNFGAEVSASNLRDRLTIIGGATADQAAISSNHVSSNFYNTATVNGEWYLQRFGALSTDVLVEKDGASVLSTINAETGNPTIPIATAGYTTNSPTFNSLGYLNQSRNCFAVWDAALDGTARTAFRTALATLLGVL